MCDVARRGVAGSRSLGVRMALVAGAPWRYTATHSNLLDVWVVGDSGARRLGPAEHPDTSRRTGRTQDNV